MMATNAVMMNANGLARFVALLPEGAVAPVVAPAEEPPVLLLPPVLDPETEVIAVLVDF